MEINLVTFSKIFLEYSWIWLNDKEIKKLTNTPSFTLKDQKKWFDSIKMKDNYRIWGINVDHTPIGVCGLKNITENDCEFWAYLGEKEYWGKGIGTVVLNSMIEIANDLNKKSIWLTVLRNNKSAFNLYTKFGFLQESTNECNLITMRLIL